MKKPSLKQNKRFFLLMMLFDLCFLLSASYVLMFFLVPFMQRLAEASRILTEELSNVADITKFSSAIMGNEAFMSVYHDMMFLFGKLLVSLLVVWMLFKSLAWFFSHKSFLRRIPFWTYVWKFCLLSCFWFACLVLAFVLSLYVAKFSQVSTYLLAIFLLLLLHFSQVSFALIPSSKTFKNTFVYGVRKRLILAVAVNIALVVVMFVLWALLAKISAWLGVVVLLALLPALAFCRFNVIIAAWQR